MSDVPADRDRQRRALGRLFVEVGGLLTDDDKRARVEARVRQLRAEVGQDPRKALELAQAIAAAFTRR